MRWGIAVSRGLVVARAGPLEDAAIEEGVQLHGLKRRKTAAVLISQ